MTVFSKPWRSLPGPTGSTELQPVLELVLIRPAGIPHRELLLVDSGADTSMGPHRLCELLGYDWSLGMPTTLYGISARVECQVPARIHPVDIYIRDASCRLTIPVCFAEGDAPLLLGREGLFDAFRIEFDKSQSVTRFELC